MTKRSTRKSLKASWTAIKEMLCNKYPVEYGIRYDALRKGVPVILEEDNYDMFFYPSGFFVFKNRTGLKAVVTGHMSFEDSLPVFNMYELQTAIDKLVTSEVMDS